MDAPRFDDGLGTRLSARFGPGIETWLADLPAVLGALAERWHLTWGPPIPRGSMSVVLSCAAGGRPAVLKVSPDRPRLATEAGALARWATAHTPAVLAVDRRVGALLIEAVPGDPLAAYPPPERVASLLDALRAPAGPEFPPLAARVAYLFESGARPYARRPDLARVVPPARYERGRQLANRLAATVAPTGLRHGDLTPANILDGGPDRGLVALDPAPCVGDDPAFDAVDLLLWRAGDVGEIEDRAARLAGVTGLDAARLLDWCVAFAAMTALELAEIPDSPPEQIHARLALTSRPGT